MKTQKEINQEILDFEAEIKLAQNEATEASRLGQTKKVNSAYNRIKKATKGIVFAKFILEYLSFNPSEDFLKSDQEKFGGILKKRKDEFFRHFSECKLMGDDLAKAKTKLKTELEIPFLEKRVKTLQYILS